MRKKKILRFKQIISVLGRYGFGYIIDSKLNNKTKSPKNLRKAFEELGPTFIKIGQILSTRPDILTKKYISELSKLQDNAPRVPIEDIKNIFKEELGKDILEIFEWFNNEPIASASIAQVHEARLKNGEEVVVKIQRPFVKEQMEIDIQILLKIIKMTKTRFEDTLIDPADAISELGSATEKELDFLYEVQNIEKFKEANKELNCIYAPYVIREFSTNKIITMEKINGIKISQKKHLQEQGYDLEEIAQKLALAYLKGVFDDGFFHGDPHPGNIMITDNKICFIDFGLVGELHDSMRASLNKLMFAIATHNTSEVVEFLLSVGIKKGKINTKKLYEDVDYMLKIYLLASLKNIRISVLFQEIFELAQSNSIALPKELTTLIRSVVLLEGVIMDLSPEIQIMDIVTPFVKSRSKEYFLNKIDKDDFTIGIYKFLKEGLNLPSKLGSLSDSIVNGRAKINLQFEESENFMNSLNKMVNRIIFGVIVGSMIVASSLVLNRNTGPVYKGVSLMGLLGYIISAIFGLWLLISIIKSGSLK